jgi:hypothetical protein
MKSVPATSGVYEFEATQETIGCWPFHDHYKMIGDRHTNSGHDRLNGNIQERRSG